MENDVKKMLEKLYEQTQVTGNTEQNIDTQTTENSIHSDSDIKDMLRKQFSATDEQVIEESHSDEESFSTSDFQTVDDELDDEDFAQEEITENPVEEALGYKSLMEEYGLTQEEAASRVGKSRPAVANALRLLNLPEEILLQVRTGALSAGHARALLALKSEKKQLEAAQKIAALGLSVRQAELLCKNMTREPAPVKEAPLQVNYIAECEKTLSHHLGRGVKIISGKRKGKFELEFYGQEDLQVLLDALMKIKK